MEITDLPTFDFRKTDAAFPAYSYESFYGVITSTSAPSWRSQSTLPARLLGGVLLGAAISPGAAIAFQEQPLIQTENGQQAIAPITVPQKLESIREAFGLSTSALADVLAVSRPTIYQWIKGQSEPSGENRARLERVSLLAAKWRDSFPGMSMDHWLTDNEPGEPSLFDLLKAENQDPKCIRDLLDQRITGARRTENGIAAERRAASDFGVPQKESATPEAVKRWSTARSEFLRTSNLHG
jgi:DNA-binding transcriptional regulator YiaG